MTIFNFEMLNVPFASGAISTEIALFPDWNRGLGIAFDQTEGKPEMKGLNGLFQVLTTSMLYLKQRGIAEWDSALEYPENAFVTEGAKLYKSKRTNTAKQPSLSQLDWDVWASISDISVSTNGNLKKAVASDGSVTLEVPTASDTTRGVVRFAGSNEVAAQSSTQAAIKPSDAASIARTTDLGVGQSWQDVKSSRNSGITYTNNTGKPIQVHVVLHDTNGVGLTVTVNGVNIINLTYDVPPGGFYPLSFIVPSNHTYRVFWAGNTGTQLINWSELR